MYRAAAAYPYVNRERATAALQAQLRVVAAAGGAVPDWTTLEVEGPTEQPGMHGRVWFEWTATVNANGGRDLTRDPIDDDVPAVSGGEDGVTMPQPPLGHQRGYGRR